MKEEQINRIKSLLTKNLLSELDEIEKRELNSWREFSEENEELYNRLQNREYIKSRYKDYNRISSKKRAFFFSPMLRRIAAVLVISLIVALSAYQIIIEINEQKTIDRNMHFEDITLIVDGSRIISLNSIEDSTDIENVCVKIDRNTIKYYPQKSKRVAVHRIVVPEIRLFKIILPDESVVWLNSKSSLSYSTNFKGSSRIVNLDGEGFFDIAKDSSRPFSVITDGAKVSVTGTQFNVKAYSEDNKIAATLVEGRINIGYLNSMGEKEGYDMKIGEQSLYNKKAGGLEVTDVNTAIYTSWKEGVYFFDKQRLEDIMRDLARWYGLEVIFKESSVKERVLSGKLSREESPEELLNTFARMVPGHIKIDGRTVTIY
ncbi:FecR family protein [Bacteroidales bacterium MB20-C3-3]|nr:FecR family protein [Bacteroidales bacterium MB20-C3-3]